MARSAARVAESVGDWVRSIHMAARQSVEAGYTVEAYFDLVRSGELSVEDHVELLEGVIVAMSPQNPRHASATTRVQEALREAIGKRAVIRVQSPFLAGARSVPEPDVAVVPGAASDYDDRHPDTALLVVEIAETSLAQDRLTKGAIYAAAGVPEYWLLDLREDVVEVFTEPDPGARRYGVRRVARRGDRLPLAASPGASVSVDDLVPRR